MYLDDRTYGDMGREANSGVTVQVSAGGSPLVDLTEVPKVTNWDAELNR